MCNGASAEMESLGKVCAQQLAMCPSGGNNASSHRRRLLTGRLSRESRPHVVSAAERNSVAANSIKSSAGCRNLRKKFEVIHVLVRDVRRDTVCKFASLARVTQLIHSNFLTFNPLTTLTLRPKCIKYIGIVQVLDFIPTFSCALRRFCLRDFVTFD